MPTDPKTCIFCKIVNGEVPCRQVLADDLVLAFHDTAPAAPVHVLVIPKEHVEMLSGTSPYHEPLMGHMLRIGAEVAKKTGITESGYRLLFNQGRNAGQQVDHLHLHVLGGNPLGRMA